MCGTVCEQQWNAVCEYMNNNYKDIRVTDIMQTISKSYKSIKLFQKLKRFWYLLVIQAQHQEFRLLNLSNSLVRHELVCLVWHQTYLIAKCKQTGDKG